MNSSRLLHSVQCVVHTVCLYFLLFATILVNKDVHTASFLQFVSSNILAFGAITLTVTDTRQSLSK